MNEKTECESCAEGGEHGVPAEGHCENPDFSGYDLCGDCIAEYDGRAPIGIAGPIPQAALNDNDIAF